MGIAEQIMDSLGEVAADRTSDNPASQSGHLQNLPENDVLRILRRSQNLTQAELADLLGVTQERVSGFERGGVARAQIGTLRRYVEALGGRLRIDIDLDGDRIDLSAS